MADPTPEQPKILEYFGRLIEDQDPVLQEIGLRGMKSILELGERDQAGYWSLLEKNNTIDVMENLQNYARQITKLTSEIFGLRRWEIDWFLTLRWFCLLRNVYVISLLRFYKDCSVFSWIKSFLKWFAREKRSVFYWKFWKKNFFDKKKIFFVDISITKTPWKNSFLVLKRKLTGLTMT